MAAFPVLLTGTWLMDGHTRTPKGAASHHSHRRHRPLQCTDSCTFSRPLSADSASRCSRTFALGALFVFFCRSGKDLCP